MSTQPKVVILGAGFGGITIAKALGKSGMCQVLIVDKHNYHNFQPLMYQVATAGLEAGSIAYPVRRIFRKQKNVRFKMSTVLSVDTKTKTLHTDRDPINYDILVIATGSKSNYFNLDSVKDKLFSLKSIEEALTLRNKIFHNLEDALSKTQNGNIQEAVSIAIVGGGPAGIELAGALAEMKRYVIPRDYPELDPAMMQINLYEAAPELLSAMSNKSSEKSLEFLRSLGVNVFLNAKVTGYNGRLLTLADGTSFPTETVIWTAGVTGASLAGLPKESIVAGGRISVNEINAIHGLEGVYAIGDVSTYITPEQPRGQPMLAPVAQQQASHLADNLVRILTNKPTKPFTYKNKGTMATVGRNRAVVELPNFAFQGFFAWFVWMFVHIISLVGFRSKILAFFDWANGYITYDKPAGLIVELPEAVSDSTEVEAI